MALWSSALSNPFAKEISKSIDDIQIHLKTIETCISLHNPTVQTEATDDEVLKQKITELEKTNKELQEFIRAREEGTLKNLIEKLQPENEQIKLKGIFPADIEKRLMYLTKLVNQASKAYKEAQGFYDYIDIKIHNEFAYLGRAMSSVFIGLVKESFDYRDEDFHLAIEDASCSARHILNDCVDLLVAHATKKRRNLLVRSPHILFRLLILIM